MINPHELTLFFRSDSCFNSQLNQIGQGARLQFLHDAGTVGFYRPFSGSLLKSDLLVEPAGDDQLKYSALPRG